MKNICPYYVNIQGLLMEKVEVTSALIRKINEGDAPSFQKLFDAYSDFLFSFARRFVEYQDAEDIVAEAFLKVWKNRKELKPLGNFKGYLTKTVQNACIDLLRTEKYRNSSQQNLAILTETEDRDFELAQLKAEVYAQIAEEVDKLPKQTKLILEMAFLKGLKNAEIAKELNLSEQTIRNTKTNGLAKLRVAFQKRPLFILFLILLEQ